MFHSIPCVSSKYSAQSMFLLNVKSENRGILRVCLMNHVCGFRLPVEAIIVDLYNSKVVAFRFIQIGAIQEKIFSRKIYYQFSFV